jgi:hypothetical protein
MQTKFKAPQRQLQSSWRSEVFKKSGKTGTIVNRSLGTRQSPIVRTNGTFVAKNTCNNGYLY